MSAYRAPIDDMQFLLFDVFAAHRQWLNTPELAALLDEDTARAMLEEAGKVADECVAPINRSGDEEGVQWDQGRVTTPAGLREAYNTFRDSGFTALTGNPEYGGLGMPKALSVLVDEMMYAANSSFNLYPALSSGACLALDAHGSEALKQRYLPNLYAGVWSGTMCLTEPHSGSDLGLIRTKAVPQSDGSYAVSGTKIFITGGEHDLTDNIVHLVLAKLPDAPAGSRGISLFLVPKISVNEDGSLGEPNGVSCGSVEHKMGIKASATCVMNFDSARGYLVGELNQGLQCMFTMMNCERLSIGIQGTGCADASYQTALAYAKERLQGRDAAGNSKEAQPIIVHADVRRMLLEMKSLTEAGRAFSVYLGIWLDQAKYAESPEQRAQADAMVALLTPVAKAFFTDMGFDSTVLGQQVLGGHGYIREWGQEQLLRDARIAQIYEGTNGIQAMDLMQRKVLANRGESMKTFLNEIEGFLRKEWSTALSGFARQLQMRVEQLSDLSDTLVNSAEQSAHEAGAAACDYLHVVGYVVYGYMWMKMMEVAELGETGGVKGNARREGKLYAGAFYFKRLLPRIDSLVASVRSGADVMMAVPEEAF